MARQLWISQSTGYRRKGTQFDEIRNLLNSGITAKVVFEPLFSCLSGTRAEDAAEALLTNDFDIAGVREGASASVVGFVQSTSLGQGVVGDYVQVIGPSHLITDATSARELLRVMKMREFSFVLVGSEVEGIVTRADLNKPPVRIYLFSLISLLEMHLDYWLHHLYGDETWKEALGRKRREAAEGLLKERRVRNHEISLVECLQMCDKRDLLVANSGWRKRLGLGNKTNAERLLKRAEDLRNNVAHSQHDLAKGTSWDEVIEIVEQVERFLEASDRQVANVTAANQAS